MKKLLFAAILAASVAHGASVRLPEYDQVAGVSGQVMRVEAKLDGIPTAVGGVSGQVYRAQADITAIMNTMRGSEGNSPYLGGIRITFNTGSHSYVPQGAEYYKALAGAVITIQSVNETYRIPIESLMAGAIQQVFVPCLVPTDVIVRTNLGPADHIYSSGAQTLHLNPGEVTATVIDTLGPMDPPHGEEHDYRMIGRAQYYDPDGSRGKRTSGESFLVVREFDPVANKWTTRYGEYWGTVWKSNCEIYNQIPQLGDDGTVVNYDSIGDMEHAFETQAFPWNEAKRVAVRVDPSMLHTSGQANPATNLFYFTRLPIYVFKETIEDFVITNKNAAGTAVSSVSTYPVKIRWVANPKITNEVDRAFYIPSWEKVYKRVKDGGSGEWSTVCLGVKEANYYACYKSSPTPAGNNDWRMAGNNVYVLQSYPWTFRSSSDVNRGVAEHSREAMHTRTQKLNPYSFRMSLVNGTVEGQFLREYPAATGDMATRRWAGNGWHDYQAFRELAYIQFGANVQNTTDGIYGNNTTSVRQNAQGDLEFYFDAQPHLVTFTPGPRTQNGLAFSWLGILNFWGSEGDQMADVTCVNQSDSDGTQSTWYLMNLDRSLWKPSLGNGGAEDITYGITASSYAAFVDTFGYEKSSYYGRYTGRSGDYYVGLDMKADYAAFQLRAPPPRDASDLFVLNLNSSGTYDALWWGGFPTIPTSGTVYNYWMCSLSDNRNIGIGPWCVSADNGPSNAGSYHWGARPSLNLLASEGEAVASP